MPELDDRGVILPCPKCGQKNRIAYERLSDPIRCGKCKHEMSAPAEPVEIARAADFDRLVAQASTPVVVDFWAPWCGPCRVIAPILEEVAKEFNGKTRVGKVNVDDSPEIASRFGVRGIPTLILFKDGQIKGQMVGVNPKSNIVSLVQKNL